MSLYAAGVAWAKLRESRERLDKHTRLAAEASADVQRHTAALIAECEKSVVVCGDGEEIPIQEFPRLLANWQAAIESGSVTPGVRDGAVCLSRDAGDGAVVVLRLTSN
jgi:hypothetical protein